VSHLVKEAIMHGCYTAGFVASFVGGLLLVAASEPAAAKILCKGIFQGTKTNGLIATPYCGDEEIARVARTYGWKVTGDQVRNDPLKKVYVCQALGGDVRIQSPCGAYAPQQYR
jgi:hypothetical protein